MNKNSKVSAHPFANRQKTEASSPIPSPISRRNFGKSMLVASMAIAAGPIAFSNAAKASSGTNLLAANPLRKLIAEQIMAYSNQTVSGRGLLENAARDDAFHGFLGQRLVEFHPALPFSVG